MQDDFVRSAMLLGREALQHLSGAHVAVFGLGGVGSYVVEGLARSGIGQLTLVDHDRVSASNLNRQLVALHSTLGRYKTEVMRERVLDINPQCKVQCVNLFFDQNSLNDFNFADYAYVVDAIDSVSSKLLLVSACEDCKTAIISAMGAGNKLDPTRFEVSDIFASSMDPLARVMRKELRKRGIKSLKVVYSPEEALTPLFEPDLEAPVGSVEKNVSSRLSRKKTPGSVAFVPSVAGLIIAGEVVRDLVKAQH